MEEKLVISGGIRLSGEIDVAGAKNSVLKQMAAALLYPGHIRLRNVPNLADVYSMIEVLEFIGAKVKFKDSILDIDSSDISGLFAPQELVNKLRASFNVMGALLGRFKEARVALPGGCQIGARKLDLHEKGLIALGANVKVEQGYMIATATKLTGARIYLDIPSNGATENIMVCGVLAEGETIIENAACDPEITDLANFLNAMGAKIEGAGTHKIVIKGVKLKDLHSTDYSVIKDRLEASTYLIAAVATGGEIIMRDIEPELLQATTSKLIEAGVDITFENNILRAKTNLQRLKPLKLSTGWFPAFPTDTQPMMAIPLCIAEGTSTVRETIYEDRFSYTNELGKMGADISVNNNIAVINGVEKLTGAKIKAQDIRAGAGLVIAGLMAEGKTEVTGLSFIDRGYENIESKFRSIGANINRTKAMTSETAESHIASENMDNSKAK